jgi:hypothetical protein
MRDPAPAGGLAGKEPNQDTRKLKFSTTTKNNHSRLPLGKNRVMILEQIADKWVRQGLYQSPSRAMYALLGGVHD